MNRCVQHHRLHDPDECRLLLLTRSSTRLKVGKNRSSSLAKLAEVGVSGVSGNSSTLRRTQAPPTIFSESPPPHSCSQHRRLPRFLASRHMTVPKAVNKGEVKSPSCHLFRLGESKDFPRSPGRLFLTSHWPELAHLAHSGHRRKE